MKHFINANGASKTAEYAWRFDGAWSKLYAHASAAPAPVEDGSLEQFITEHYWGYSTQGNGHSLEYHVSHVPWNVWTSTVAGFEGEVGGLYGFELGKALQRRPDSAFIADGSPVIVFAGSKIQ
jgi:uncharacterized protein